MEEVTIARHEPLQPVREGLWKRELLDRPGLLLVEWFMDGGVESKPHGHEADQAAYYVSGKFELTLDERVTTVGPGDSHFIPSGARHALRCVEQGSYLLATLPTTGAHEHGEVGHGGHDHAGHRH